jgi:N-acetylmuramoyl-L-alanine amidase
MRKFTLTLLVALILISACGINVYAQGQNFSGIWGIESDALVSINGRIIELERQTVMINGRIVVPARTTFENLAVRTDWYEERNMVKLSNDYLYVTMNIGRTKAYVNGVPLEMEAPPILVNGTVMVPLRFTAETFKSRVTWNGNDRIAYIGDRAQTTTSRGTGSNRNYVVVVDAGHGGKDPGAISGGIREKDLNLDIAKRLNSLLKAEGITTHMTRSTDTFIDLYARSGLANRVNADLLISIHNNAGTSKYSGSMSLYYPSSSKSKGNLSSWEFANIVNRNLSSKLGSKNLGLQARSNLAVLRTSNMPAVIAEVGFITNSSECAKLLTAHYKQKAAEALRDATLESLDKMY